LECKWLVAILAEPRSAHIGERKNSFSCWVLRIRKDQGIAAQDGLDGGIQRLRHDGNGNDWSQGDRKEWGVELAAFVTKPVDESVIC
jgi:hypothetical protein